MKCFICSSLKDRYKFSVNFIKKGQKVILTDNIFQLANCSIYKYYKKLLKQVLVKVVFNHYTLTGSIPKKYGTPLIYVSLGSTQISSFSATDLFRLSLLKDKMAIKFKSKKISCIFFSFITMQRSVDISLLHGGYFLLINGMRSLVRTIFNQVYQVLIVN